MKINITKLLYVENGFYEVNEGYLDKVTQVPKEKSFRWKYSCPEGDWIDIDSFNARAEKFIGRNISELYYSYKKENKTSTRPLIEVIRDCIDITNRAGEIACWRGGIRNYRRNDFYTDENHIICKYEKPEKKKPERTQTDLELLKQDYYELEGEMLLQKKILRERHLHGYIRMSNSEINRAMSVYIDSLKTIEQEYNSLYNFIYCRDLRDKPDRKIRVINIKPNISNKNIKPKNTGVVIKEIVRPDCLVKKSIFSILTGLN